MNRILIIEDDTDINNMMAEALQKAGYECTQAFSGTEGLLYIERDAFSLAVLDLMLPGMNGEKLLPQIKEKQNIPVIVVSAKDSIDSKVGLLTSGAEDYLTKPFDIQEFIARVGVQIRRFSGQGGKGSAGEETVLSYRELELYTDSYTAAVCGKPVELTRRSLRYWSFCLSIRTRFFQSRISMIMPGTIFISGRTRRSMCISAISGRS